LDKKHIYTLHDLTRNLEDKKMHSHPEEEEEDEEEDDDEEEW